MKQLHYINLDWKLEVHQATDTGMMKLSVLLLLALPALSSTGPLEIGSNTEQRNVSSLNPFVNVSLEIDPNNAPLLTVAKLRQKRQLQSSSFESDVSSNLEWVTFNDSIPTNAVSVYTKYVDRTDYICKYKCEAGYYHPSKGPVCYYPQGKKEYSGSPFEILVNKDSFEIVEWKWDSKGQAPKNAVRTCPGKDIYVGRHKYGLGKVCTQCEGFVLPWRGTTYWYNDYEVLTIDQNVISQEIYDVKYDTDESKLLKYPPKVLRETAISNNECQSVVKTDTLSKTYKVEQSWDIHFSVTVGVQTTFTVGIPSIVESGIHFSTEVTFEYSQGKKTEESVTDTVSVQITAPPNRACVCKMLEYKSKLNIPFTARLRRTYANGAIHTTTIYGTYESVQIDQVKVVLDRCEVLNSTQPCT